MTINGVYKAEVIHRRGPWKTKQAVELATLEWVAWFNHHRLMGPLGYVPPAEFEAHYHRQRAGQATIAWLKPTGLLGKRGDSLPSSAFIYRLMVEPSRPGRRNTPPLGQCRSAYSCRDRWRIQMRIISSLCITVARRDGHRTSGAAGGRWKIFPSSPACGTAVQPMHGRLRRPWRPLDRRSRTTSLDTRLPAC